LVATHGRAFWALDDISPLRTLADSITAKPAHLFAPAPAVRWVSTGGGRAGGAAGANPYYGVSVDYWLGQAPAKPLTLQFLDATGTVLRSFRSDAAPARDSTGVPAADSAAAAIRAQQRAPQLAYEPGTSTAPARAGSNRFVWNLMEEEPKTIPGAIVDDGSTDGPRAIPGEYRVRLLVGKDTLERPFTVKPDPRVTLAAEEYVAQRDAARTVARRITSITEAVLRVQELQQQLDQRARQAQGQPYVDSVRGAATALRGKLEGVRSELYEVYTRADQATLNYPIKLYQMFITLNDQVNEGTNPPTRQHGAVLDDLTGKLNAQLTTLRTLEEKELGAFNALLQRLGIPGVFVPPAKPIS
jgi:hypothetical protein